jgi:hypothetical protein
MKDQQLSPENIFFITSRRAGENWIPFRADEFFPRNKIVVRGIAGTHPLHNSAQSAKRLRASVDSPSPRLAHPGTMAAPDFSCRVRQPRLVCR